MCYNQWTQFEEFPRFMQGVKSVEQVDDKTLRWTAQIGGKEKSWEAQITYQKPDERVAWRSTAGPLQEGSVAFEALGPEACVIRLVVSFEPEGADETLGTALGIVGARIEGDLRRFKEFIERRPAETGAWRGEIRNRAVTRSGAAASRRPGPRKSAAKTAASSTARKRVADRGGRSTVRR